jgi:hypothetical protein
VQSTDDIDAIEDMIGAGQIEQIQQQADAELSLAQKMTEWKPWYALLALGSLFSFAHYLCFLAHCLSPSVRLGRALSLSHTLSNGCVPGVC